MGRAEGSETGFAWRSCAPPGGLRPPYLYASARAPALAEDSRAGHAFGITDDPSRPLELAVQAAPG